jgi:hypothetical protein
MKITDLQISNQNAIKKADWGHAADLYKKIHVSEQKKGNRPYLLQLPFLYKLLCSVR